MHTLRRITDALRFRFKIMAALLRLKLQRRGPDGELVVSYSWAKLPFTNDGDLQEIIYHAHFDEWHAKVLKELGSYIKPGDCVVDVGANLGFMALIFSELVGKDGAVLAFEPSAKTFRKLERTLAVNHCANVKAHNLGCGDKPARMTLFQTAGASGNASLLGTTSDHTRTGGEEIEIVRLDDLLLPESRQVNFMKMDVEGFEPSVLRGAKGLIQRDRPIICIELNTEFKQSGMESIAILKSLGYRILNEPNLEAGYVLDDFIALPPA